MLTNLLAFTLSEKLPNCTTQALAAGIFCSVLAVALGLAAAVVLVVVLVVFFDDVVDVVFLAVLVVDLVDEVTGTAVLFTGVEFEMSVVVLASVEGALGVGVAVGVAASMGAISDKDGVDAVDVGFAVVVFVAVVEDVDLAGGALLNAGADGNGCTCSNTTPLVDCEVLEVEDDWVVGATSGTVVALSGIGTAKSSDLAGGSGTWEESFNSSSGMERPKNKGIKISPKPTNNKKPIMRFLSLISTA